jgi:hypothetical protein
MWAAVQGVSFVFAVRAARGGVTGEGLLDVTAGS